MDGKEPIVDFKKELEGRMVEMANRNGLTDRGGYISDDFLQELFTSKNIEQRLIHDYEQSYQLSELEEFIRKRAKRVYAVLVLIDEPRRIRDLKNRKPAVDDALLFQSLDDYSSMSYCKKETLEKYLELAEVAERFYEMQWAFPPTLSSCDVLHFDAKFFRFPFKTRPNRIGSGGSGQVHEVEIEGGNIKYPDDFEANTKIVYKKIRQEDQDEKKWGRLQQEVQTLRARQHVNITPLLASFSAGLEIPSGPNDDTKCLYLISPRALMDMHDWMKKEPTYVQKLEDHEFRNHIWDAMRGLISGLTFVHRQIGGEVGYHGDLKPKNILLFESSPKWTWKICDFGSSNLKSIDETGTKNLRTSYYWAPKEYFVKDVHTDGQDHGRAHDVWSLGCIFLLLATMLRHRWRPEGLEEFKKLRAGNDDDDEAHAFHNSMHAVQQWIHGLETTAQRKRFKHIVKLVEEMLKPREERIFSWEVEVDLYCIIDADRPDKQILDHLKRVIQPARKADRGLKHDPLARARSRGRKGPFLDILMENEWYDEETTDEQKTAMIARRSISTLPPPEEKEPIFGRELLFNRISELFKETRSVALSGLGGIGKTLAARHYVSQITGLQQNNPIKHTFWVRADSVASFKESYRTIAAKLDPQNPKFLGENILYEAVKSRLEDTPTEPWFMVIDGLDHSQEARVIEPLLPRRGYGWMLFTTRNRYLVRNLVELKKQACAEVELPSEKASLQMFKHYVDGSLVDEEEVHAKKLLNLLCCPDIIRRAAEDMNVHKRTCEHMCDEMMDDIFTKVEHLRPNFAEFLLKPILTSPLRPGCEWSGELELLFQLCMFNNQIGVDFKLIGVEYERGSHSNVRHMLDTLRGCFLISVRERSGDTERPLYLVNKIVEMAVRTWIKTNEGQIGFLARYNKALSMMFRSYDQRKRADQRNKRNKPGKATSSSNRYKAFFLPHFEGFVTFTSVAHEPFDFRLYYRAVQAVVTFSSTLLDADRHDDAIRVLEFARRHYKWTDLEAQDDIRKQRCRGAYFALNQRLVKAYLSGPREDKSRSDFTNAENLVQTLQREATTADDTFPCAGKTLRKWDLSLDMVRVLWESGKLDKAWQQFEEIKKINIVIDKRDAILPDFQIPSNPQDSKYEEKIRQELQRLATMVKCEQGLLNLATGQEHYRKKDMREARRSWEAAREAFLDAKVAVEQWFSHDSRQLANIELHLAEAYMKVGRKEDLCAVVSTFERELEQVSERVGNRCRRACDIEYKLNAARLERGSHDDVEQVELSSRQLFEHNQITLGSDHDRTIECAAQLREAYVRR